jgi:hypothetical protein
MLEWSLRFQPRLTRWRCVSLAPAARDNGGTGRRSQQVVSGVSVFVVCASLTISSVGASTPSESIVQVPVQVARTTDGNVG